MANPWFRMYAEFATDPKVQMMSEEMQRRLIMLFCLRCSDVTVTLCDEEIAFQLRISDEQLAETKALFVRKGFIDSSWDIVNWNRRQFSSDTSAERTRAYRERKKNGDKLCVTSPSRHSDALDTDTDTDTDTDNNYSLNANVSEPKKKIPFQQIVDLFNNSLPELPQVQKLNDTRKAAIKARWNQNHEMQNLEHWERFFKFIRRSDFLMGRTSANFSATFDWIFNASNFLKIYEGNYENKESA